MGGTLWVALYGWLSMGGALWVALYGWRSMGGALWVALYGCRSMGAALWVALYGGSLWVALYGWLSMGGALWVALYGWHSLGGTLWVAIYGWLSSICRHNPNPTSEKKAAHRQALGEGRGTRDEGREARSEELLNKKLVLDPGCYVRSSSPQYKPSVPGAGTDHLPKFNPT